MPAERRVVTRGTRHGAQRVTNRVVGAVLARVGRAVTAWREPIVSTVARDRDPFTILISCLLSLRTKDATTAAASARLFALARTPEAILALTPRAIERAI